MLYILAADFRRSTKTFVKLVHPLSWTFSFLCGHWGLTEKERKVFSKRQKLSVNIYHMNIFICASKYNYGRVAPIKAELEAMGHKITVPNSYDEPMKEEDMKKIGPEAHRQWKAAMIRLQAEKVEANDAVLVLNFEKNGQPNYLGGATFLEIFRAFDKGKKIFLFNPVPDNIFKDELLGMGPMVIHGDLSKIKMSIQDS